MVLGQLLWEDCWVLEGDLVVGAAALADRVGPDVVAGLTLAQPDRALGIDGIRAFVGHGGLPAAALGGFLAGVEGTGPPLGEHDHQLVAVGIGVGALERGVLLLVDHDVVDAEAALLADENVAEASQTAAAVLDALANHPDADAARLGDPVDGGQHLLGVEGIALVEAQVVVGRAGEHQIDRIGSAAGVEEIDGVADIEGVGLEGARVCGSRMPGALAPGGSLLARAHRRARHSQTAAMRPLLAAGANRGPGRARNAAYRPCQAQGGVLGWSARGEAR